jgi:hypothetical protein
MKDFQKVGGVGAVLQAAFFVLLFVYVFVVLPSQGLAGPTALTDPAKALPFAANSPILSLVNLIFVPLVIGIILVVLALYERLQGGSPGVVRIATAAGLVGTALFLARAMIGFVAPSPLAQLYAHNPAGAGAAYIALSSVIGGLGDAATFAVGSFQLLVSWAALQRGGLPKPLSYLGLLAGAVGILAFTIPQGGLIGAAIALVWSLWLGVVLLRVQSIKQEATATAEA